MSFQETQAYEYQPHASLTPEQREIQRQQIEAHLQNVLLQIVQCDEFYCPDLQDLTLTAVYLAGMMRDPLEFEKFKDCVDDVNRDTNDDCSASFLVLLHKNLPHIQDRVDIKRHAYHKKPLLGYDGQKYNAPFWFEGAGDIWRKSAHQSTENPYVTVHDCHQIRIASENCLADPTRPQEECFKLYGHSLSCAAGINCPDLRFPLLYCLQSQHTVNFDGVKSCIQKIPDYEQCCLRPKKPWVPEWDRDKMKKNKDAV